MRRSVREASLGFCLLVAIASGLHPVRGRSAGCPGTGADPGHDRLGCRLFTVQKPILIQFPRSAPSKAVQ
jgi:hypothetical protein